MAKAKYTVLVRIESEDSSGISTWVRVGFAIPGKNGNDINIKLHTLPVLRDTWDGWLYIRENEEPEIRAEKFAKKARDKKVKAHMYQDVPEDDIPF